MNKIRGVEKDRNFAWVIISQFCIILWKLFLMMLLIVGRIIIMIISLITSQIEDYLKVPKKKL